jgi:steroid 5-alpha reductase family enzyme
VKPAEEPKKESMMSRQERSVHSIRRSEVHPKYLTPLALTRHHLQAAAVKQRNITFNMVTHRPVHVLDDYYLAITLLITVAYQLIGFAIAFTFKFDKITDFMGGTNFVWLAIITLAMGGSTHPRQIITSIMIMLWGARLSGFLLFRILKTGKDDRFDDKRDKFFSFLGFWIFQMLWVWTVSLPVTILNSPNVLQVRQPSFGKATDIIATIIFVLAFSLETVSDAQKYRFKQGPGKQPGAVCDVGFFKYSRHPNYFAEIMTQVCKYIKSSHVTIRNYR